MKPLNILSRCTALFLGTLVGTSAMAASPGIVLPEDTMKLRRSDLAGYAVATQKCVICHSVDYVSYQPPGLSQAQWTAEVQKMQRTYGAPLNDIEVRQIGAYLAVAYGSAKATDAAIVAASAPAQAEAAASSAPAQQGPKVDVKALLANNACLSCHGLQQQIVGPGFNDVAKKYKAEAKGQAMLEHSIRTGSSGKWGSGVMPPFATLKPEEIKALSTFVLEQ